MGTDIKEAPIKKKLLALGIISVFALGACSDDGGGTDGTAGPADTGGGVATTAIAPTTAPAG